MKQLFGLAMGALVATACAEGETIDPESLRGQETGGSESAGSAVVDESGGSITPGSGGSDLTGSGGSGGAGVVTGGQAGGAGTMQSSSGGGGHGGSADGAGSGGSPGAGGSSVGSCTSTSDAGSGVAGFSVLYGASNKGMTSPYIQAVIQAKNGTASSVNVSDLKVRYYMTDEVKQSPMLTINWGHISTSGADAMLGVTPMFAALPLAGCHADSYIEFSLSSGSHPSLAAGESAVFSWQMNGPDQAHDVYTQSNDYSFDSTKNVGDAMAVWDHIVLLRNGEVVWGTPP
jgi:endoglucanase